MNNVSHISTVHLCICVTPVAASPAVEEVDRQLSEETPMDTAETATEAQPEEPVVEEDDVKDAWDATSDEEEEEEG